MTGTHDDQVPGQAYAMGGRITTEPEGDSIRVTITGGRLAQRLDTHHARITCGDCGASLDIERSDEEPLRDGDITAALTNLRHCSGDDQAAAPDLSEGWGEGAKHPPGHTAGEGPSECEGFKHLEEGS